MILTAASISQEVKKGSIVIDPFDENRLNPNSYNYRLGTSIKTSKLGSEFCDAREITWIESDIPDSGYLLLPDTYYLCSTFDCIGSTVYSMKLIGRSSIGRLGLFLQLSAPLGHVGSKHCWTLELRSIKKLWIYPMMDIGQVSFWKCRGELSYYSGSYAAFDHPTPMIPRSK